MTTPISEPDDQPIDLEELPAEEGMSKADAVERVDRDPEEQQNREDVR